MKSSKIAKTVGSVALSAAMAVAMCPALALASAGDDGATPTATKMTVQAKKSSKNMKARGVKFDLKKGKWKTVKSPLYGSYLKYKVRVAKVKTSAADIEGYKRTVFTVQIKLSKMPSKAKVLKHLKYHYKHGSVGKFPPDFHLVDYVTGENLEYDGNSRGFSVESIAEKSTYTKKYRYKSEKMDFVKRNSIKVAVEYPRDYKNMTIGVGAPLTLKNLVLRSFYNANDDSFLFRGNHPSEGIWYKTSFFKRDISNYHFMRIK